MMMLGDVMMCRCDVDDDVDAKQIYDNRCMTTDDKQLYLMI